MKTALHTSICELFETHALAPAQIAEQLGIEEVLVTATLLQFSTTFREETRENDKPLVTKDEVNEFMLAYKNLARYSEDDGLKERALRNLINMGTKVQDGLGVSDARKLLQGVAGSANIINLNAVIQRAKMAKARVESKVIDVLTIEDTKEEEIANRASQ